MNIDQQTRLEIMQALEKDFPDRLLEDLIDVARYVEGGGVERVREVEAGVFERAREESQESAAKYPDEADDISERHTWMNLDRIPDDVRAVTDADGYAIRRVDLGNRLVWKFEDARYEDMIVNDGFGPFAEVLF